MRSPHVIPSRPWLPLLLSISGCGATTTARPSAAGGFETDAVRPMTLRYRGVHRGDHPEWRYAAHVRIEPAAYGDQPAWRHSYWIEAESRTSDPPPQFRATTVVHRDTLALLEGEDVLGGAFGDARTRVAARGGRLTGEVDAGGQKTPLELEARGLVVKELDLIALAAPQRAGYRAELAVLDDEHHTLRRFSLVVEGPERIQVPAGELETWRIAIAPLDGTGRLATTVHVGSGPRRVVVRKQYVVNPETTGDRRRSVGTEELEAIEEGAP